MNAEKNNSSESLLTDRVEWEFLFPNDKICQYRNSSRKLQNGVKYLTLGLNLPEIIRNKYPLRME